MNTSLDNAMRWHQSGARFVAVFPSGRVVTEDPDRPGRFAIRTSALDETIEADDMDLVGCYRAEAESSGYCPLCLLFGDQEDVRDVVDSSGIECRFCETCGDVSYGRTDFDLALDTWYKTTVHTLARKLALK